MFIRSFIQSFIHSFIHSYAQTWVTNIYQKDISSYFEVTFLLELFPSSPT
jgi:hypothetical protein